MLLLRAHQHHILSEKLLLGPKQHVQHSFPNQARVKDLCAHCLSLGKHPIVQLNKETPYQDQLLLNGRHAHQGVCCLRRLK